MGLIKREQIEDKGTLTIEKKMPILPHKPAKKVFVPVDEPLLPPAGGVSFDMDKVRGEAQKLVEQAREKAEAIREQAREEGRQEGRQEASARIEEALKTLNDAVIERKKIIKDAEPEILRLAIKVAEQIIRSEVSLHRDVCLNIVSEAISRVSDREQIIVKVNREDAEYLKRYKDRLAGMLDGVKSFSIIEDNNIEPGGCVVETSLGFIDARIATKIKSIEEAVNKVEAGREAVESED